jgi:hypothetical protein
LAAKSRKSVYKKEESPYTTKEELSKKKSGLVGESTGG